MHISPEEPAATRILDDLRRIVRALHESSRSLERDLGVTGAQLFALRLLARFPNSSLKELAARTRTHQSTVSVVVKRLVLAGLVRRGTSDEDRRRVELVVTTKGRSMLSKAPSVAQERLVEGIDRMAPREQALLATSLDRLVVAMELEDELPGMFFEEQDASPEEKGKRARG